MRLISLHSPNVAGRDENREKQGGTASGVPLVGLQGTYTGTANEGRSQEAYLSEGGLGSGEWIAVVGVLPDVDYGVSTDMNTAGLQLKRHCHEFWIFPCPLPSHTAVLSMPMLLS